MSLLGSVRDDTDHTAARAQLASPAMLRAVVGEVKSYDPATNTVDVNYPHADGSPTQTQRMSLMTHWGSQGYGDQGGVDVGAQVLVLQLDPEGDDVIAIGFLFNDVDAPLGAPAGEHWKSHKSGSSMRLTNDGQHSGDGQGGLQLKGAGYASLVAPLVEAGAHNLDPIQDAVVRVSDLNAAFQAFVPMVQAWVGQYAAKSLQPGAGAPPPLNAPSTPSVVGSSVVKAAP